MSWYILGIDIGLNGFACLKKVGSNRVRAVPVPHTSPPPLRNALYLGDINVEHYDIRKMYEIAQAAHDKAEGAIIAVMEQPFARKTSNSAVVEMLRSQGFWTAACAIAGIPAFYLEATSWKSRIGFKKVTDKIKNVDERSRVSKQMSIDKANELVGWQQFHSHDAAEAFLIAYSLETFYDEQFGWLKKEYPVAENPA